MKRFLGLLILLLYCIGAIFPQQLWTGNALQSGSSDFGAQGLYAASNAFPLGTLVDVTNPLTGETVRVEVTSRLRDPGLFLLLSSQAAQQLGVEGRYPTVVQAEPVASRSDSSPGVAEDAPFSTDPDLNPAASVGDPNAFLFDDSPVPEVVVSPEPAEVPEQPVRQEPGETKPQIAEPSSQTDPARPDSQVAQGRPSGEPAPSSETSPESTSAESSEAASPGDQPAVPRDTPLQDPFDLAVDKSLLLAEVESVQDRETPEEGPGPLQAPEQSAEPIIDQPALAQAPEVEPPVSPTPESGPSDPGVSESGAPEPSEQGKPPGPVPAKVRPLPSQGIRSALDQFGPPSVNTASILARPQEPSPLGVEAPEEPPVTDGSLVAGLPLGRETALPQGETRRPESSESPETQPYASPMAGNPADQALEDYFQRFGGAPSSLGALGAEEGEVSLARQIPPQGSPVALADVPQPKTDFARVEVSPGRLQPGLAQDLTVPGLPLASFAAEAETYDDLFPRLPSPGEAVPEVAGLPQAQPAERPLPEEPSPRLSAPGGIRQGLTDAVPAPQVAAPETPDAPLPREQAPEAGRYIITLVPAEFKPPEEDTPETGLYAESGPESAGAADLAAPQPRQPDSGLYASAQDPKADSTLAEPSRRDPETGLYSQAGPETPVAAGLSEPGTPPKPGAEVPGEQVAVPPKDQSPADLQAEPPLMAQAQEPSDVEGRVALPADPETPERLDPAQPGPEQDPRVAALAEPQATAPSTPETGTDREQELQTADDLLVFLEPVEDRTPAGPEPDDKTEPDGSPEPSRPSVTSAPSTQPGKFPAEKESPEAILAQLPIVTRLQPEQYYLQVGAFSNPESARTAVSAISPGYPIAVEPIKSGERQLYRLYVGPLTEDEKGTVLYWFRARGYRDAFIRQGL